MVYGGEKMNRRVVLVLSILILVCVGFATFYIFDRKVPMDPSYSGNTPGNLQNGGLFFEMGNKVYFSNTSDNNCLYSMNLDESDPQRLTSMQSSYINGADGFLYFYMDSHKKSANVTGFGSATEQYGLYRCKASGSSQVCLAREISKNVQLCGEYVYYQTLNNGVSLERIKCDKKDQSLVEADDISPVCYDNGLIYYSNISTNNSIYALPTSGAGSSVPVVAGSCFYPVVQDNYIYYMNGEDNYSIWRTNLLTGEQQVVTSDRVDCFNVDKSHVYYAFSDADAPALRRCDHNGENKVIMYSGVVNSINLTSRYVYFKVFGEDDVTYHMPLDGSAGATPFIVSSK